MMTETETADASIALFANDPPPPPGWGAYGSAPNPGRDDPDERYLMDEAEMNIRGVIALARQAGTTLTSYEAIIRAIVEQTPTKWESPVLHYAVYFLWPDETPTMMDAAKRLFALRNG